MAASSRWRAAYDARAAVALSSDRLHHDQCRRPYLLAHNVARLGASPKHPSLAAHVSPLLPPRTPRPTSARCAPRAIIDAEAPPYIRRPACAHRQDDAQHHRQPFPIACPFALLNRHPTQPLSARRHRVSSLVPCSKHIREHTPRCAMPDASPIRGATAAWPTLPQSPPCAPRPDAVEFHRYRSPLRLNTTLSTFHVSQRAPLPFPHRARHLYCWTAII
ncbi:hypothetical protein B0H13DRAFT_2662170 [Mycena leptocephala]|nr:hypothetical protein B0H13DRAFT_2662170 [Mycena leptocephala]